MSCAPNELRAGDELRGGGGGARREHRALARVDGEEERRRELARKVADERRRLLRERPRPRRALAVGAPVLVVVAVEVDAVGVAPPAPVAALDGGARRGVEHRDHADVGRPRQRVDARLQPLRDVRRRAAAEHLGELQQHLGRQQLARVLAADEERARPVRREQGVGHRLQRVHARPRRVRRAARVELAQLEVGLVAELAQRARNLGGGVVRRELRAEERARRVGVGGGLREGGGAARRRAERAERQWEHRSCLLEAWPTRDAISLQRCAAGV